MSAIPTLHPGDHPVPLSALERGSRATVHRCLLSGDEGELLAAMGLADRCTLRVCRRGEPCIVQIAATRLGLSAAVARRVLVVPVADPSAAASDDGS